MFIFDKNNCYLQLHYDFVFRVKYHEQLLKQKMFCKLQNNTISRWFWIIKRRKKLIIASSN
jgi:hypothetical protein